jgi:hypothetical protein
VIGKRRASSVYEDEDSENVDPSIFNSPNKKSKTTDESLKPFTYSLMSSTKPSSAITTSPPTVPSVRKALSQPSTSNSTPIGHSRGSPKHKRIGVLSKRRVSSSPFRRIDPPSFSNSPALPFSIDAALKGSIPDYTPKATPTPAPSHVSTLEESMPKSWFFDIHEDTPEQEAANLMEHSAAILDISSDDDSETKRRNENRGKENIPPPDWILMQSSQLSTSATGMKADELNVVEHVKLPRLRKIAQDAMDEDRQALSDLPPADFYAEGLDATSCVTVEVGCEKPSRLSKELSFDTIPSPEQEGNKEEDGAPVNPIVEEALIQIYADENAVCETVASAPVEDTNHVTDAIAEGQQEAGAVAP